MVEISASIVTFNSPIGLLSETLDSLRRALRHARAQGEDISMRVLVVDNSTDAAYRQEVRDLVGGDAGEGVGGDAGEGFGGDAGEGGSVGTGFDSLECWCPGANIGYGAAHNEALKRVDSQFHLILNPDVEFDEDALHVGLEYLRAKRDVVMVSPAARDAQGREQYLCRRYPSVLVLGLRGFAPRFVRRWFRAYLHGYELRDVCGAEASGGTGVEVPLVSGCCMYARTSALRAVGGFSPRFFMYFEDFDLSLRLHSQGRLMHLPDMRIVHHGGNAARKGLRHILMFVHSAWKFFRLHGWRWV